MGRERHAHTPGGRPGNILLQQVAMQRMPRLRPMTSARRLHGEAAPRANCMFPESRKHTPAGGGGEGVRGATLESAKPRCTG